MSPRRRAGVGIFLLSASAIVLGVRSGDHFTAVAGCGLAVVGILLIVFGRE